MSHGEGLLFTFPFSVPFDFRSFGRVFSVFVNLLFIFASHDTGEFISTLLPFMNTSRVIKIPGTR